MREALSGAAQLPFQVAATLTDEVAYQVEGLGHGHRSELEHDPRQLYHEDSVQMRQHTDEDHRTGVNSMCAEILEVARQQSFLKIQAKQTIAGGKEYFDVCAGSERQRQAIDTDQQIGSSQAGASLEQGNHTDAQLGRSINSSDEGSEGGRPATEGQHPQFVGRCRLQGACAEMMEKDVASQPRPHAVHSEISSPTTSTSSAVRASL